MTRSLPILITAAGLCGALGAQTQASALQLEHRDGQTFLTWSESAASPVPESYNVYRSVTPIAAPADLVRATKIASVAKGSYLNARSGKPLVLKNLGAPLKKGEAVYVTTATANRAWYYAVLAVRNNSEDRSISRTAGGNSAGPIRETIAPVKPILQSVTGGKDHHYVHFPPAVTTTFVPAQTNRAGRAVNFRVYWDKAQSGPRPVFLFLHARSGTYKTGSIGWTPANAIQLFTDDENAPAVHSVWFGNHPDFASGPPKTTVQDYTERRILWTLRQVLADKALEADRNRVYSFGVSLGAMGSLAMGSRYPDIFAAAGGLVPAFSLTHSDFSLKKEIAELFGTPAQNLPTSLGEKIYDLFDAKAQLARRGKLGVAPMFFVGGRGDTVTGWTEKPAVFRAAQAARQPISFYWDFRTHTGTGPWTPLESTLFTEMARVRLDRPVPAFSNLSLDDDPGDGNRLKGDVTGAIAGYVEFDPDTPRETASRVDIDIGLKSNASRRDYAKQAHATVDVTWRRLRAFRVQAGSYYRARTKRKGQTQTLEERIVVPDANGLLTVTRLGVERWQRTLQLEKYVPALPEMHIGGENRTGGTLAVSLLAKPKSFAMLTIGGIETSLKTPFGTWRILDPFVLWGGVTPNSGQLELILQVPNETRFRGVRLLSQSMVGFSLTNLAKITLR